MKNKKSNGIDIAPKKKIGGPSDGFARLNGFFLFKINGILMQLQWILMSGTTIKLCFNFKTPNIANLIGQLKEI